MNVPSVDWFLIAAFMVIFGTASWTFRRVWRERLREQARRNAAQQERPAGR